MKSRLMADRLRTRGFARVLVGLFVCLAGALDGVEAWNGPGAQERAVGISDGRIGVDETNPLMLTMFDAVRMALENNRELQVERINVRQSEFDLFSARGAHDISVTAGGFLENRTIPTGSILAGSPDGSQTTRSGTYELGGGQLLSSGGQWQALLTNSRINTNNQFVLLNPQYNAEIRLEFRQPLMRNLSIDDARRRIHISNRRLDLSDSQFRQKAIEVISRVQRSYWDLVFALRDVQIRREAVDLAGTQLEQNRRLVSEGTLAPIELVSVEVELERRAEEVLTAIEAVTRAENALKQLLLSDRQASEWSRAISPVDEPSLDGDRISLDDAIRSALLNRVEFGQNDLQREINRLDIDFLKNQTRPRVDLVAGYATTGLSGSGADRTNPFAGTTALLIERLNLLSGLSGLPPVVSPPDAELPSGLIGGYGQGLRNLLSNDFRTLRFGVTINFPLKNRTAEGQLGRALAEDRKLDSQRKMMEQTVEAEVRNALQSVATARRRVESARSSREAARKQLDSEQRRFEAGMSTTFLVLERQNALSQAQGREQRALTDHNKAIAELQRVMGTTLMFVNVDVKSVIGNRE